jgi:hypothetical protein
MASVFAEASPSLKGVFSSNRAGVSGPGGKAFGVVTNVQINFSQQISRVYDLNKKNVGGDGKAPMYYVGGRAEGRATFGRLIGPGASGCDFYEKYGNICKIAGTSIQLTFHGSGTLDPTCQGQKVKYTLTSPICISVGISMNAQDTMVNENAQFMFADMECAAV